MTSKIDLRSSMRATRRAFVGGLTETERERLERSLAARLAALLTGPTASYAAMGAEIDPRFVEAHAPALLFPRVGGERLTFHRAGYAELAPGFAGIAEPPLSSPETRPAVILVPLVAADLHGNRIGQGAAHYDRSLATLRAVGPVTAIGLAWEVQIVAAIPADPWDEPLDWLATPERLVDCRGGR